MYNIKETFKKDNPTIKEIITSSIKSIIIKNV